VQVNGQLHAPAALPPRKFSVKGKKNVKFALEQTMKAQKGSRSIVLLFL
jgi:hypothetical protein